MNEIKFRCRFVFLVMINYSWVEWDGSKKNYTTSIRGNFISNIHEAQIKKKKNASILCVFGPT